MNTLWICLTCHRSGEGSKEADSHGKATRHGVLTTVSRPLWQQLKDQQTNTKTIPRLRLKEPGAAT